MKKIRRCMEKTRRCMRETRRCMGKTRAFLLCPVFALAPNICPVLSDKIVRQKTDRWVAKADTSDI